MNILVKRAGALGDVILTTAVLRRLRQENLDVNLFVETGYPDVFRNNPHVTGINVGIPPSRCDKVVDLDLAYEKRPGMHIVEAYMREAFGEDDDAHAHVWTQELFFDRKSLFAGTAAAGPNRYVAVHAATAGWRSRTLPRETWHAVLDGLHRAGLRPILVGTRRDMLDTGLAARFEVPDILAQTRLISSCACFVGSDSALLHAAGATDTPIVGVFTCASPEYRMPVHRGGCIPVFARNLDCLGCLHHRNPPVTTDACERGDWGCVSAVRADDIVEAVAKMVED